MNIHSKNQDGFTIIEVIVSSFVFSIMAIAVVAVFFGVINLERRSFAAQKIQENGQFILELMAREIRVSRIQNQDSNCTLTALTITHPINGVVTYSLENGILYRTANDPVTGANVKTELSSTEISFPRLNFCVNGSNPTDQQQTRVAILSAIENTKGREKFIFNIQTTITTRDYGTEL